MHIFFSFYYSYDFDRIQQVIGLWTSNGKHSATPFIEDQVIEEMKVVGLPMIHRWIDEEIAQADAVVVLIGELVFGRYFIEYEIQSAIQQGKPLIGLYIHSIKDQQGKVSQKGENPLPSHYPVYEWKQDITLFELEEWFGKK